MNVQSYCFKGNCDDLEAWCPEIDAAKDCCSPFIQTKCPSSCDACPGTHHLLVDEL